MFDLLQEPNSGAAGSTPHTRYFCRWCTPALAQRRNVLECLAFAEERKSQVLRVRARRVKLACGKNPLPNGSFCDVVTTNSELARAALAPSIDGSHEESEEQMSVEKRTGRIEMPAALRVDEELSRTIRLRAAVNDDLIAKHRRIV